MKIIKIPDIIPKNIIPINELDEESCDEVMAEEIRLRENPYYDAIKILEEFKVIDDWSAVYMPQLHDAIDTLINAVKEAYDKR